MGKPARARSLEEKYKYWFSSCPEEDIEFGPDPLMMRKSGAGRIRVDVATYKDRLTDHVYLDFAIDKIAQELCHFLVK